MWKFQKRNIQDSSLHYSTPLEAVATWEEQVVAIPIVILDIALVVVD